MQVFKPLIDNRYQVEQVASHAGTTFAAHPVISSSEIEGLLDPETTVVAIDEAQFFDDGIVDLVQRLADRGLRVIVAGLDTDFRGEPFGCMPVLMAVAERVDKLQAICMVCGDRPADAALVMESRRTTMTRYHVGSEMYEAAAASITRFHQLTIRSSHDPLPRRFEEVLIRKMWLRSGSPP